MQKQNVLFAILLTVLVGMIMQNVVAPLVQSGDPDPIGNLITRDQVGEPRVLTSREIFEAPLGGLQVGREPAEFQLSSTCLDLYLPEDAGVVMAATKESYREIEITVDVKYSGKVSACSPYRTTVILWYE